MPTPIADYLDTVFTFKPGDHVVRRAALEHMRSEFTVNKELMDSYNRRATVLKPIAVSERVLKQCHGGIQAFYSVHEQDAEGRGILSLLPDHELVSVKDADDFAREVAAHLKSLRETK